MYGHSPSDVPRVPLDGGQLCGPTHGIGIMGTNGQPRSDFVQTRAISPASPRCIYLHLLNKCRRSSLLGTFSRLISGANLKFCLGRLGPTVFFLRRCRTTLAVPHVEAIGDQTGQKKKKCR
jgi:hypothetical protein